MFQHSLLDDSQLALDSCSIPYFSGNSLVENGQMQTLMGTVNKPLPSRVTRVGDQIDAYRNLNKPGLFSMKQRQGESKGLVTGYAQSIVLSHPQFVVGEQARQTVLRKKSRNVHAFTRGIFIDAINGDLQIARLHDFLRVSYSPYVSGSFYSLERDGDGKLIKASIKPFDAPEQYRFAVLNGADVILTNDKII